MQNTLQTTLGGTLAALVLGPLPASATVSFFNGYSGTPTEVSSTTELAYAGDVSNSDLIEGLTPTISGWTNNGSNGAHSDQLNDGVHGGSFFDVGNMVQGAWTSPGAIAEYTLGTGANGLGYDLTSIQSIAAWVNVGFGDQAWTIDVRPVGGSYLTLATIAFEPTSDGGATKVTLSDLNATGIEAIRFTANSVNGGANGGAFVARELDVFGLDTVPEPSSIALLALGGLALLRRRRRA